MTDLKDICKKKDRKQEYAINRHVIWWNPPVCVHCISLCMTIFQDENWETGTIFLARPSDLRVDNVSSCLGYMTNAFYILYVNMLNTT